MFNLSELSALAANEVASAVNLTEMSITLIFTAVDTLQQRENWISDDGFTPVSDAEWDIIEAHVAELLTEMFNGTT